MHLQDSKAKIDQNKTSEAQRPKERGAETDRLDTTSVEFLASVARAAIDRGFPVTFLNPGQKKPILKHFNESWRFISTHEELSRWLTEKFNGKKGKSVGIPSNLGVGKLIFLDIDGDDIEDRIVRETGREMPVTFTVQSRPKTAKHKKHFYFLQTEYSVLHLSKQTNVKDLTRWVNSENTGLPIHPTIYDVKGTGKGGFVVAAGSYRADTDEFYKDFVDAEVCEIPPYLVDWLVQDKARFNREKRAEQANRKQEIARRAEEIVAGSIAPPIKPNTQDEIFFFISSRAAKLRAIRVSVPDACALIEKLIAQDFEDGELLAEKLREKIHRMVCAYKEGEPYAAPIKDDVPVQIRSTRLATGGMRIFRKPRIESVAERLQIMFGGLPKDRYENEEMRKHIKHVWPEYDPQLPNHTSQVSKARKDAGWKRDGLAWVRSVRSAQ